NCRPVMTVPRIDPQVARSSADHHADVATRNLVLPARLQDDRAQLLLGVRDLQQDRPRRAIEPLDVLLQPEDPPAVRPDPLEDAVAIQEPMIEYRNPRVLSFHEPAVQIDLLAHTPLLSLGRVPKYSTAPWVLQHGSPACRTLLLSQPIHRSHPRPRRALWHVFPAHSASITPPGS